VEKNDEFVFVELDFVQLEICVAAVLSQDPVLLKELQDGVDIHSNNQHAFKLPDRLTAKKFVFRLLYGGSAYSYANDPEFNHISKTKRYWQKVIDRFYDKYTGIKKWHTGLIENVVSKGTYTSPFGRNFTFTPTSRGDLPETDIKNYIVQGTGADIISAFRVLLHKRLQNVTNTTFITTVHDSILLRCLRQEFTIALSAIKGVARVLPSFLETKFGLIWNCPCRVEVKAGPDWGSGLEIIYKG
jgi:DNA polymerase I-like protein with 3'-5' exonuclease and polymerase domains